MQCNAMQCNAMQYITNTIGGSKFMLPISLQVQTADSNVCLVETMPEEANFLGKSHYVILGIFADMEDLVL